MACDLAEYGPEDAPRTQGQAAGTGGYVSWFVQSGRAWEGGFRGAGW